MTFEAAKLIVTNRTRLMKLHRAREFITTAAPGPSLIKNNNRILYFIME